MYVHNMYRVRTDSWILEKVLKIAKQFVQPWKNGKKSEVFIFKLTALSA